MGRSERRLSVRDFSASDANEIYKYAAISFADTVNWSSTFGFV